MTKNKWEEKNNVLIKDFRFSGFKDAMDFANQIAELANKANHHPDIFIHGYSNVEVRLTTHSANSTITEKDYNLAKEIDDL